MVKFMVVSLFVEVIPIGVLMGDVFPRFQLDPGLAGPKRRRRPRFWLRFAGVVIAMWLPLLVGFVARLGDQFALPLLFSQLPWGILVVVLSRFVLFDGPRFSPGSDDGDDDGPGPGDDRPTPPAPTGGIPLPYPEPSSTRVRDHRRSRRTLSGGRPRQRTLGVVVNRPSVWPDR